MHARLASLFAAYAKDAGWISRPQHMLPYAVCACLSSPNENDFLEGAHDDLAAVSFRDRAGRPGTVAARPAVHYIQARHLNKLG
jgi:hypothetical protein